MDNSTTPDHMAPKGAQIWPFDRNLKSLSDIEPAAGFVATLVPEGKFGGAVAVTEGTENLIPLNRQKFEGWTAYQDAQVTITQDISVPEWNTSQATRIQTSGGTSLSKYYFPIVAPSVDGQDYSLSVRIKNIGSKVVVISGNLSGMIETIVPGETKYVKLSGIGNGTTNFQCYFRAENITDSLDFIAYQPMPEEKPFSTSFVEGTRAAGILSYPDLAEKFNQREFTFAAWWKPYTELGIGSSIWDRFFQIDNGTGTVGNKIRLSRIYNSSGLMLELPNADGSGSQQYSFYPNSYPANAWHFVACVLDVPNLKARIHLNDEFQEFTLSEVPTMLDLQRFFLGSFGTFGQLNGELDNVLYAPEAVSIETIQKWSQLTRPFIPWREPPKPYEAIIDFQATGADEIYQNVKTIIETPAGTVPFDREFGINRDLLDMPMTQAQGRLTIEYIEKIRRYEPRAKVKEVTFVHEPLSGVIKPRVVIELVD